MSSAVEEEKNLEDLIGDIFDLDEKDVEPELPGEKPPRNEEEHYHEALESLQDQEETEEAMVEGFKGIDKKRPGVWEIFRSKIKRTVEHQKGIDRGLAKMGQHQRIPFLQLAVLFCATFVAYGALSNKQLVAEAGQALSVPMTQYEVVAVVVAACVIVILLARSGRLRGGGAKK